MNDDQVLNQLSQTDVYAPGTEMPATAWSRDAALAEIERRMGMEPRASTDHPTAALLDRDDRRGTMQTQPTQVPTTVPPQKKRRLVALGTAFAVVAAVAGIAIWLSSLGDRGDDVTLARPASPVTTEPPTVPPPIAAVEAAIDAYNAGDVDGWVAAFDPGAEEAQPEAWGYFFEILMNANQQLVVVEPCRVISAGPSVVECTLAVTDDFHGPAGISDTAPAQFHLNDQLRITEWANNGDCCAAQFAFNTAFHQWLRASHFEVYAQIQPNDIESLPGFRTDPADMGIAIQYVEEFVAQSNIYPIDLTSP